jgi:hypothetical protein
VWPLTAPELAWLTGDLLWRAAVAPHTIPSQPPEPG